MNRTSFILLIAILLTIGTSCNPKPTPSNDSSTVPGVTSTLLPPIPVKPGEANPDEPVFISGAIPYTSPFFLASTAEPFVMLEDEAGFVKRDQEFEFLLQGQAIGPVEIDEEDKLTYYLSLPAIPQGTYVDVDNDDTEDLGIQVFAVAYWSNTWGGPFLEERDGKGWSSAYASTITNPEDDYEITGGTLVVWSPDEEQGFPTDFGADGKLFTADDPTGPIPAGYNLVDLNQKPFKVYKEANTKLDLIEGAGEVNDYSSLSYEEAFQKLFEKASREYPFTEEKSLDWEVLYSEYLPRFKEVGSSKEFNRLLREFSYRIPDGHVGVSFDPDIFYDEHGGGFGLVLGELSDGRVLVKEVLADLPADRGGIRAEAEIISWNGKPVSEAVEEVVPFFGPYSTQHAKHRGQVDFLTRVPPEIEIEIVFINPEENQEKNVVLKADVEYDSLFKILPGYDQDPLALPIEGNILDESGLGYIRINTFQDDYNLLARLWERNIQNLLDNETPGLILDLRNNSGGSGGLAMDFAGYLFDEEFLLHENFYYNEITGLFEKNDYPTRVKPAPLLFEGPVAVLVGPSCVSACEFFAYALQHENRSIILGNYPTAGAAGEVGLGQYTLPDEISMQFPTGRPETSDGKVVIEGTGVIPDITVPVTEESLLEQEDTLLEAAIQALLQEIE